MLVEPSAAVELARTEVALPRLAVESRLGRDIHLVDPADEVLGDGVIGVLGANNLVHCLAVEMGRLFACVGLVVVSEAGGSHEAVLAERARDGVAAVSAGVEVLVSVRLW